MGSTVIRGQCRGAISRARGVSANIHRQARRYVWVPPNGHLGEGHSRVFSREPPTSREKAPFAVDLKALALDPTLHGLPIGRELCQLIGRTLPADHDPSLLPSAPCRVPLRGHVSTSPSHGSTPSVGGVHFITPSPAAEQIAPWKPRCSPDRAIVALERGHPPRARPLAWPASRARTHPIAAPQTIGWTTEALVARAAAGIRSAHTHPRVEFD